MTDNQIDKLLEAIAEVSTSLDRLGVGNASTEMGAIENLAKEVKDGSEKIASSIEYLADAIVQLQPSHRQ